MNAANLFAQLSGKSSDYSMMPFGGAENAINMALYTSGMYRRAYLAARLVWSKDLSVHNELTCHIITQTIAIAENEGWNLSRCRSRVEMLCRLATLEHYSPQIFRTQTSRYRCMQIPESQWYRLWSKRYEVPYTLISSYLDIAYRSVHR